MEQVKKVIEDNNECSGENCPELMEQNDECSREICRLVEVPIPVSSPCAELMQPRTMSRCSLDVNRGSTLCTQLLSSATDPPCPKATKVTCNLTKEACDKRRGRGERRASNLPGWKKLSKNLNQTPEAMEQT